jgi:hypothetical protein
MWRFGNLPKQLQGRGRDDSHREYDVPPVQRMPPGRYLDTRPGHGPPKVVTREFPAIALWRGDMAKQRKMMWFERVPGTNEDGAVRGSKDDCESSKGLGWEPMKGEPR